MSKGVYYRIDCEECKRLGLTGTDKDVYFFIKAFKDGLTMGQQKIAENIPTSIDSVKRSLRRLIQMGLIVKCESDVEFNGGKVLMYKINPTGKMPEGYRSKCPRGKGKMPEGYRSKCPTGKGKMPEGTPYINTSNKQDIITSNIQRGIDPELITISELVLIEWNSHYERHFNTGYVPDYRSLTNDKNLIVDAVKTKMVDFKKNPNSVADAEEFIRAMYEAMFSAADEWQRKNWSLHTVATQFNQLYNAIINKKNGNNNSNKNSGISDDYIARKMREAGLL